MDAIAETYRRAKLEPSTGRPFRAPHFSTRPLASSAADGLVNGSLPRQGVLPGQPLRLREAVPPVLRQAIEEGSGTVARDGAVDHQFHLAGAMRSCPCGNAGNAYHECTPRPRAVDRHWAPVEEAILDLVHQVVEVPALCLCEYLGGPGETRPGSRAGPGRQGSPARRVRQNTLNAHLPAGALPEVCEPDAKGRQLLNTAFDRLGLTIRETGIILRVARTIADLAGAETPGAPHVAEAIQYRSLARRQRGLPAGGAERSHLPMPKRRSGLSLRSS